MEVGLVTGGTGGVAATLGAGNFSDVLAHFSPVSKKRAPLVKNEGDMGAEISGAGLPPSSNRENVKAGAATNRDTVKRLEEGGSPAPEISAPVIAREPQIDLLIATDCISEGQNLQDCGTLINFDVHWNPVRLVQRFGRIDRIGSRHSHIQMINFWPVKTLDEYINLRNRVESRMALAVLTASGDDNLLEGTRSESATATSNCCGSKTRFWIWKRWGNR